MKYPYVSSKQKNYYEMPELVGFQTMVNLDPNGMAFDAVGVFGLVFWLLFKSGSSYCVWESGINVPPWINVAPGTFDKKK